MRYCVLIVLGIALWFVAIIGASATSTLHDQLPEAALTLSSGLFLVAGVLYLARWRLTEDPRAAHTALAWLVLGVGLPASALVGPVLRGPDALGALAPGTSLPFLVIAIGLLTRPTAPRAIARRHGRLVTAATICTVAGLLIARHVLPVLARRGVVVALGTSVCVAWLLVAVRERGWGSNWSAMPYALLSAAALVHAVVIGVLGSHRGLAPGLQLAAAVVLVCHARATARDAHHRTRSESERMAAALTVARSQLEEAERAQRLRLHDARTVMAGVLGATDLLAAPGPDVDVAELRRLIAYELQRLHALLDATTREPIEHFDLADALAPVVLVHQLDGRLIRADLRSLPVIGRRGATATVLDNLLRNAALHAPGAAVTVRTVSSGDVTTVVVEDDGPGIDPTDEERLLQFAARGAVTQADGEGIGLYSCASAMHDQGGTLRLGPRVGGGARVSFSLPAAQSLAFPTEGSDAHDAAPTSRAS